MERRRLRVADEIGNFRDGQRRLAKMLFRNFARDAADQLVERRAGGRQPTLQRPRRSRGAHRAAIVSDAGRRDSTSSACCSSTLRRTASSCPTVRPLRMGGPRSNGGTGTSSAVRQESRRSRSDASKRPSPGIWPMTWARTNRHCHCRASTAQRTEESTSRSSSAPAFSSKYELRSSQSVLPRRRCLFHEQQHVEVLLDFHRQQIVRGRGI